MKKKSRPNSNPVHRHIIAGMRVSLNKAEIKTLNELGKISEKARAAQLTEGTESVPYSAEGEMLWCTICKCYHHSSAPHIKHPGQHEAFKKELASLLNKYSKENGSDTPDYILADYLVGCLDTFNLTVRARHKHRSPFLPQAVDYPSPRMAVCLRAAVSSLERSQYLKALEAIAEAKSINGSLGTEPMDLYPQDYEYLLEAESNIRAGRISSAESAINRILEHGET